MKRLIIVWSLMVCNSVFAAVYRHTDEHGNVLYTDKSAPISSSSKVTVEEIISDSESTEYARTSQYQPVKRVSYSNHNSRQSTKVNKKKVTENLAQYSKLEVISPADDQGFHSNSGILDVSVNVSPALRDGHSLLAFVDGKEHGSGTASSITLNNLERGTHSLQIKILDNSGNVVQSSSTTTFHIIKTTIAQVNRNREQAKANKNKPKASTLPINLPKK